MRHIPCKLSQMVRGSWAAKRFWCLKTVIPVYFDHIKQNKAGIVLIIARIWSTTWNELICWETRTLHPTIRVDTHDPCSRPVFWGRRLGPPIRVVSHVDCWSCVWPDLTHTHDYLVQMLAIEWKTAMDCTVCVRDSYVWVADAGCVSAIRTFPSSPSTWSCTSKQLEAQCAR